MEQALYQRAADVVGQEFAELFDELRGDVSHLIALQARAAARLPHLDAGQQAQVDAQRMSPAEEATFHAGLRRLDDLDEDGVLDVVEAVIRGALEDEQEFAFLYEHASEEHAQAVERRRIMLERMQRARS